MWCKPGAICGGVLWKVKLSSTGSTNKEMLLTLRLWKSMDGSRWMLLSMAACTSFQVQANSSHSLITSKVQWSLRPLIFQSVIWVNLGRTIPFHMDFCKSLSCLLHCKKMQSVAGATSGTICRSDREHAAEFGLLHRGIEREERMFPQSVGCWFWFKNQLRNNEEVKKNRLSSDLVDWMICRIHCDLRTSQWQRCSAKQRTLTDRQILRCHYLNWISQSMSQNAINNIDVEFEALSWTMVTKSLNHWVRFWSIKTSRGLSTLLASVI